MSQWYRLSKSNDRARFADIMRQMDARYFALSSEELEEWVDRKVQIGRLPELYGWFDNDLKDIDHLLQVMAVTSVLDDEGRRSDIGLPMLGIAADMIPESAWMADIETWLERFLVCVKSLVGLDTEFRAIRPKTMTFKPMERMHDLMREGIEFDSDDPSEGKLYARVFKEKDIGHSFYWNMKIVPVANRDLLKLVVVGEEMSPVSR